MKKENKSENFRKSKENKIANKIESERRKN